LRALSYLGKISYGAYVFHFATVRLATILVGEQWPTPEWAWVCRAIIAETITLAASVVSYELLEKTFLRMKRTFTFVESRPE